LREHLRIVRHLMSLYTHLIDRVSWTGTTSPDAATSAIAALERGDVVFVPSLRFVVHPDEAVLVTRAIRVLERLKGRRLA